MTLIKTNSLDTWRLKSNSFHSNYTDLSKGQFRNVSFDPNLPYVYLPDHDFLRMVETWAMSNDKVWCSYHSNFCKFKYSCPTVIKNHFSWNMTIDLFDEKNSTAFQIFVSEDALINGTAFGDTQFTCYMPVFRSNLKDQYTWYLGNVVLQQYYLVFDMTPYDEHSLDYIQIGIGPKNASYVTGSDIYCSRNQTGCKWKRA